MWRMSVGTEFQTDGPATENARSLNLVKATDTIYGNIYSFTNRVVDIWNNLPNYVVPCDTVNTFKARLDMFWQDQEVVYDFRDEIHRTGSRSCH